MALRATTIRFSDDLWQQLEVAAGVRGVSMAQYVREAALQRLGVLDAAPEPAPSPSPAPAPAAGVADPERLAALAATGLLDRGATPGLDRLTALAARFLHAPVVLVSLVDADRQYFASCIGLPEPWASRRETPLSHSFCQHVVASREPMMLTDAREHPVLKDNLAIRDLGVVAYLGVPLIDRGGHVLGSLCAIDSEPRLWTTEHLDTLRDLAEAVVGQIELEAARAG